MGEIYDFTEFKLHQLMERAYRAGDDDLAETYRLCLDEYLLGNIAISFKDGWPTIVDADI